MRCQCCHGPAEVGNADLAATLCRPCDTAFYAWWDTKPGRKPSDWPAWSPGAAQRGRDEARDLVANTASRPLTVDQTNTLALWHKYRRELTS